MIYGSESCYMVKFGRSKEQYYWLGFETYKVCAPRDDLSFFVHLVLHITNFSLALIAQGYFSPQSSAADAAGGRIALITAPGQSMFSNTDSLKNTKKKKQNKNKIKVVVRWWQIIKLYRILGTLHFKSLPIQQPSACSNKRHFAQYPHWCN